MRRVSQMLLSGHRVIISDYTCRFTPRHDTVYAVLTYPSAARSRHDVRDACFESVPLRHRDTGDVSNVLVAYACRHQAAHAAAECASGGGGGNRVVEVVPRAARDLEHMATMMGMPLAVILSVRCDLDDPRRSEKHEISYTAGRAAPWLVDDDDDIDGDGAD